jgi:predicted xylose isomerase-like sugar epimerase
VVRSWALVRAASTTPGEAIDELATQTRSEPVPSSRPRRPSQLAPHAKECGSRLASLPPLPGANDDLSSHGRFVSGLAQLLGDLLNNRSITTVVRPKHVERCASRTRLSVLSAGVCAKWHILAGYVRLP